MVQSVGEPLSILQIRQIFHIFKPRMRFVFGRVFRAQSRMASALLRQAEKDRDSAATESAPSFIVFRINSSISETKKKHKNLIVCCRKSFLDFYYFSRAQFLRPIYSLFHLLSWLHSHFLYLFSSNFQSPPNSHFRHHFQFILQISAYLFGKD